MADRAPTLHFLPDHHRPEQGQVRSRISLVKVNRPYRVAVQWLDVVRVVEGADKVQDLRIKFRTRHRRKHSEVDPVFHVPLGAVVNRAVTVRKPSRTATCHKRSHKTALAVGVG